MAEIFNFYVQDNRSINFPKNNLLEPIMQEDHNVAVWRFRIPKVLNDIDMSGYAWWFVYVNAKGQEFSELLTLVDDIDEPDSFCTADYSIDYGISYHPGNFQFSLEAINADSGGEVLNEWHTKTYAHKVDKTLQGNQAQWAETESDIISALIVEVQNKVAQLVGGATPEPVSLIADMTDTSKVYLYIGEESGESTNYWYHYNGSTWVAGGLYASGIIVDAIPTQGSANAVRSGGVWSALQAKGDVKTINGIEPDASGNIEIEAGGGLSDNAVELLIGILNEGLFGTNQADNIIALNAELRGNVLSTISAVLNDIPLIGMPFNDLDFTVTATYSDGTTAEVSSFAVSDGTVVSGSNTATITYRGKTTTVTFEASYVTAYTITYNLTDVTSSNMTTVTAGESSYTTTLSIASGYSFGSCTVTMGGVDITNDVYSNMEILIQSVTGDVVITANAVQETVLDPLIRINKNVEGVVFAYSDDYQTQTTRLNNSAVPLVTEYPALNACTLKWTLTNTSNEAVSISAVGMGCIPAYDSSWRTDSYFRVAYWQAITIQGGSLGAGESLEGYYTLPAGYQFVFINNSVGKDVLTLSLVGGYVADTFAGYKKITSTGYSTTYGAYRTFTWYRDNGVTELLKANSQRYVLFDDTLDAGTYDVLYRLKGDVTALSATSDKVVVGAVMSNTDTSANNSFGYAGNIQFNVWFKGTLGVSDNGMTLLGREGSINGEIIEMYCKEVA